MARIDIPRVLDRLGLANEDWGPITATYAALSAGWRGTTTLPNEATFNSTWATIEAEDATQTVGGREADEWSMLDVIDVSAIYYLADKLSIPEATVNTELRAFHKIRVGR